MESAVHNFIVKLTPERKHDVHEVSVSQYNTTHISRVACYNIPPQINHL